MPSKETTRKCMDRLIHKTFINLLYATELVRAMEKMSLGDDEIIAIMRHDYDDKTIESAMKIAKSETYKAKAEENDKEMFKGFAVFKMSNIPKYEGKPFLFNPGETKEGE